MARTKQTALKPGGQPAKAPRTPAAGGKKKAPRAQKAPKVPAGPKPHRYRPGTVALREIRKLQKTTETLLRPTAFLRLAREVVDADAKSSGFIPNVVPPNGWRIKRDAATALQTLSESFLLQLFTKSYLLTVARGTPRNPRVTCDGRDIIMAYKIGVPLSENVRAPVPNAMYELARG
jgi:histone H3/H4